MLHCLKLGCNAACATVAIAEKIVCVTNSHKLCRGLMQMLRLCCQQQSASKLLCFQSCAGASQFALTAADYLTLIFGALCSQHNTPLKQSFAMQMVLPIDVDFLVSNHLSGTDSVQQLLRWAAAGAASVIPAWHMTADSAASQQHATKLVTGTASRMLCTRCTEGAHSLQTLF